MSPTHTTVMKGKSCINYNHNSYVRSRIKFHWFKLSVNEIIMPPSQNSFILKKLSVLKNFH